jgi:hypothetical protein
MQETKRQELCIKQKNNWSENKKSLQIQGQFISKFLEPLRLHIPI